MNEDFSAAFSLLALNVLALNASRCLTQLGKSPYWAVFTVRSPSCSSAAGELLRLAGVFKHNATGVRDYRSFAVVCRKVQSDAPVRPASLNAAGVALWLSSTPADWQNPAIWDETVMLTAGQT